MEKPVSSRREFFLYWAGIFVVAFSFVSILLTFSGLITNVLSTNCYIPYVSPMLGVVQPAATQTAVTSVTVTSVNGTQPIPYQQLYPPPYQPPYQYCYGSPIAAVVQFTFQLLSSLIFTGVGAYMMLNGKKH
jgi:hypothetical protein